MKWYKIVYKTDLCGLLRPFYFLTGEKQQEMNVGHVTLEQASKFVGYRILIDLFEKQQEKNVGHVSF
ncbi:hypothetical protein HanIR_Chr17g0901061 [Helianthus annuus]|nr:hypothetical protein HanIR_Chr17g0901061 [Helianthus annuus]